MLSLGSSGDLWRAFNACWAQLDRAELGALSLPSHEDMRFTGWGQMLHAKLRVDHVHATPNEVLPFMHYRHVLCTTSWSSSG